MSITIEEVRKIAQLARIELSSAEEKRYAETISVVLNYMKILNEVDTTGVMPTAQVTGLLNVAREDIPRDSQIQQELVVPGVFEVI